MENGKYKMGNGNSNLFQVILEILGDTFVEMHAGVSTHVMWLTGIDEKVGLCTSLDTCLEERQTMLGHNGIVVIASDNL